MTNYDFTKCSIDQNTDFNPKIEFKVNFNKDFKLKGKPIKINDIKCETKTIYKFIIYNI